MPPITRAIARPESHPIKKLFVRSSLFFGMERVWQGISGGAAHRHPNPILPDIGIVSDDCAGEWWVGNAL
jgi:hypothetical protein